MGIVISALSFPISWAVRLATVLYKRVLGGEKAEVDSFVSRIKKFGACPAIMEGF